MGTTRVLIADDQEVIRTGLRMIVDHEPDLTVVAEAANGAEAVDRSAAALPDVVLMDVRMPVVDGIEATRRIVEASADAPGVLVLTTFDDDEYVFGALRAGASGFLLKDVGAGPLIDAIHAVARRESLLAPTVTRRLVERFVELDRRAAPGAPAPAPGEPLAGCGRAGAGLLGTLTERENEVLAGLAAGRSNGELAAELYVSEATIKTHVSSLLAKLGLRSRVQAVIYAYEAGLVRPGDDRPLDLWSTGTP